MYRERFEVPQQDHIARPLIFCPARPSLFAVVPNRIAFNNRIGFSSVAINLA